MASIKLFDYFTKDVKVFYKLTIFLFLVFLIPLCFLSYLFYHKIQETAKSEIIKFYSNVIIQYSDNINSKLNIYNILLGNITSNNIILKTLSNEPESDINILELSNTISKEIDSLIFRDINNEMYSVMIYSFNEKFPSDGKHISNINLIKDESWYDKMKNIKAPTLFYNKIAAPQIEIISLARPILNISNNDAPFKILGMVKVDIKMKTFFNNLFNTRNNELGDIYILDQENNVIFCNKVSENYILSKAQLNKMLTLKSENITNQKIENKYILIDENINNYWKILFIVPSNSIQKKVFSIIASMIIIIFILIIGFIFIDILFSKTFSNRILTLIHKMEKVEEGDFDIKEIVYGNDEIGTIDKYFNKMVQKIIILINENYIQKLKEKESELICLQMQINPHFLYNTLDMISAMASVYGCRDISKVSQRMGDLFRYSIDASSCEFVTLKEEINHVEKYLYIQKIRYEELLNVVYEIPEKYMDCRILKLIIQPLVENAINHGLYKKGEKGILKINVFNKDKDLVIEVSDDGIGMTQETIEQVMSYINNESHTNNYKKSIGLLNVNARLRLKYGDKYGISMESHSGKGTRVSILMPFDV